MESNHETENEVEEELLKIGELAAFFNVSVKAIRLYEKKGIMLPAWVDPETGYRYYLAHHIHQLNVIIELKALGFSLNEIKEIMDGKCSSKAMIHALQEKKKDWENLIAMAENKVQAIHTVSKKLADSKEADELEKLSDEERAWLLVKMVCIEDIQSQSTLSEAIWL